MRSLLLVCASLLALSTVSCAEDPTESLPGKLKIAGVLSVSRAQLKTQAQTLSTGVQDLTPETFDKFVNSGKHALVEFYAPVRPLDRVSCCLLSHMPAWS